MADSISILDHQFLEMRWRTLSLAADLDRIARATGGAATIKSDPRITKLRKGFEILLSDAPNRAEQFELLMSDMTPPPAK